MNMSKETRLVVDAPDRINAERLDSADGSVDGEELDAVYKKHLVVKGVDVGDVADFAKGLGSDLDSVGDASQVVGRELPDGLIGIGINHDRQLDLTLVLLDVGSVLGLGLGVVVGSDVVDSELVLLKDVLALGSIAQIIVANKDTASVIRHCIEEAGILQQVREVHVK